MQLVADRGFGVLAGMGKFSVMNDHGQPGSLFTSRWGCQGVRAVQKVTSAVSRFGYGTGLYPSHHSQLIASLKGIGGYPRLPMI